MRQMIKPILAISALALSALGLVAPVNTASAAMISPVPAYSHIQGSGVQLPVELVARKRRHGHGYNRHRHGHRYNRHRHGHRYRYRRHGYGHYYGGYWYRTPWWILGTGVAIGAGAAAASSGGGYCAEKSRACARNWGPSGPDYDGCMRYEGC